MKLTLQELRDLHPDTNGGDHSRVGEFVALLKRVRNVCRCGCGRPLRAGRKGSKYFDHLHFIIHRRGQTAQRAIGMVLLFTFFIFHFSLAGDVTLAWDASSTPGCTYTLYAATNALSATNLTSAAVKVNAGTNLTAQVTDLRPPATWYFVATANLGGVQSDPSNQVIVQVPAAPANQRIVAIQYGITLTNFVDTGFFRLRIPAPAP